MLIVCITFKSSVVFCGSYYYFIITQLNQGGRNFVYKNAYRCVAYTSKSKNHNLLLHSPKQESDEQLNKETRLLSSKPESVCKQLNKLCSSIMQSVGDSGSSLVECGSMFGVNPRCDALILNPDYLRARTRRVHHYYEAYSYSPSTTELL